MKGYIRLFGNLSDAVHIANARSANYRVPEFIERTRPSGAKGTTDRVERTRLVPAYIGVYNNRSGNNSDTILFLPSPQKNRGVMCIVWALQSTAAKHIEIDDGNTSESSNRELDSVNEYAVYIPTGSEWKFINTGVGRPL